MTSPLPIGQLIVICAPSGTGKSTLLARLKAARPQLRWSVSCTTRPIRPGELDGVDYHYISAADFENRIAFGDFIEWAKVHSNLYGTSKTFVDQGRANGDALLFDLDVQGADAMKRIYGADAKVIFIEPPSRGTDPEHVIQERLDNAARELVRRHDFDFLVTNDDVEGAYRHLEGVVDQILGGARVR
jgi:guanylate kinase